MHDLNVEIVDADRWNALFQLRYGVFGLAKPDYRYLLHDVQMMRDPYDDHSFQLGAFDGEIAVATIRLYPRSSGPYIEDEAFRWSALADYVGTGVGDFQNDTGVVTRGAVRDGYRRWGLADRLIERAMAVAASKGMTWIIGNIDAGNDASVAWLIGKHGFDVYHRCPRFISIVRSVAAYERERAGC